MFCFQNDSDLPTLSCVVSVHENSKKFFPVILQTQGYSREIGKDGEVLDCPPIWYKMDNEDITAESFPEAIYISGSLTIAMRKLFFELILTISHDLEVVHDKKTDKYRYNGTFDCGNYQHAMKIADPVFEKYKKKYRGLDMFVEAFTEIAIVRNCCDSLLLQLQHRNYDLTGAAVGTGLTDLATMLHCVTYVETITAMNPEMKTNFDRNYKTHYAHAKSLTGGYNGGSTSENVLIKYIRRFVPKQNGDPEEIEELENPPFDIYKTTNGNPVFTEDHMKVIFNDNNPTPNIASRADWCAQIAGCPFVFGESKSQDDASNKDIQFGLLTTANCLAWHERGIFIYSTNTATRIYSLFREREVRDTEVMPHLKATFQQFAYDCKPMIRRPTTRKKVAIPTLRRHDEVKGSVIEDWEADTQELWQDSNQNLQDLITNHMKIIDVLWMLCTTNIKSLEAVAQRFEQSRQDNMVGVPKFMSNTSVHHDQQKKEVFNYGNVFIYNECYEFWDMVTQNLDVIGDGADSILRVVMEKAEQVESQVLQLLENAHICTESERVSRFANEESYGQHGKLGYDKIGTGDSGKDWYEEVQLFLTARQASLLRRAYGESTHILLLEQIIAAARAAKEKKQFVLECSDSEDDDVTRERKEIARRRTRSEIEVVQDVLSQWTKVSAAEKAGKAVAELIVVNTSPNRPKASRQRDSVSPEGKSKKPKTN